MADIYPKFLALSAPLEISAIMPVTPGITIPALNPPNTREIIRIVKVCPAANINSEIENKTRPMQMISFLPNLSAKVPPNGEITICDSANAATNTPKSLPFKPKSFK